VGEVHARLMGGGERSAVCRLHQSVLYKLTDFELFPSTREIGCTS